MFNFGLFHSKYCVENDKLSKDRIIIYIFPLIQNLFSQNTTFFNSVKHLLE